MHAQKSPHPFPELKLKGVRMAISDMLIAHNSDLYGTV
jgi:hypothetical protein